MQHLKRHKDLLWMAAGGAALMLTQGQPPDLIARACLGLFLIFQTMAIAHSLRAAADAAREVEPSADLLRAPELEALLEGFRPLHVLALSAGGLRVDQPYWSREGTLAEIAMLPEGPHLRLSSLRPDGRRIVTAQPHPLLDAQPIPGAERELVADPQALLQRHAARAARAAAEPVLPMDRALSLGICRQAARTLARQEALAQLFVAVGLSGAVLGCLGWLASAPSWAELTIGTLLGLGLLATLAPLSTRVARWLEARLPGAWPWAEALRQLGADAGQGPVQLPSERSSRPNPLSELKEQREEQQRRTYQLLGLSSAAAIAIGLLYWLRSA